MLAEETSGVTEEVLMDATEIITAIIVARGLETHRVAHSSRRMERKHQRAQEDREG